MTLLPEAPEAQLREEALAPPHTGTSPCFLSIW